MMSTMAEMTSSRPYLIRALYQWIEDNGLTPYILVDSSVPGVRVPPQAVKDGKVVLNIATRAVHKLDLADDVISFQARFNGVSTLVVVPVSAVNAIYSMENGQGMVLPPEVATAPGIEAVPESGPDPDAELELPPEVDTGDDDDSSPGGTSRRGRSGHLRVIK